MQHTQNPVTRYMTEGHSREDILKIEEYILACPLIDPTTSEVLQEEITAPMFYFEQHQIAYRIMQEMISKGEHIDLITFTKRLQDSAQWKDHGFEKATVWTIQLTDGVYSVEHLETHVKILKEDYTKRTVAKGSQELIANLIDTTPEDLVSQTFALAEELNEIQTPTGSQSSRIEDLVLTRIKELDQKQDGHLRGVDTGLQAINDVTRGWRKRNLIIIAARPGMGKTALMLQFARGASESETPTPVLIFSLEMAKQELTNRLLSNACEIPHDKIQNEELEISDTAKLLKYADKLKHIHIDDTPALTIQQIRMRAKAAKRKHGIGLIILDYLQLADVDNSIKTTNRDEKIGYISRGLKALAKELGIPVIALAQLNRNNETRGGNKRPILSDLRESGNIEQDADMVAFLHRPEYYKIMHDEEGNSTAGLAEIIIAKHRNGRIGKKVVGWNGDKMRFYNLHTKRYEDEDQTPRPEPPAFA